MFIFQTKPRLPFLISALLLLVVAAGLLAWCRWPFPTQEQTLSLSVDKLNSIYSGSQIPDFLKKEGRQLVLNFPQEMRKGQSGHISLRWAIQTPIPANSAAGSSTDILVQARLELLGFLQTPSDDVVAPLVQGEPLLLQWQVIPSQAGAYTGSIWSYLNLGESSVSASDSSASYDPVAVQNIQIQVDGLLGLGYSTVLWMSYVGFGGALLLLVLAFVSFKKKSRKKKSLAKRKSARS